MRSYDRKDGQRRTLTPLPYPLLTDTWLLLRSLTKWAQSTILRRRLHHGYKIVEPKDLAEAGFSLTH